MRLAIASVIKFDFSEAKGLVCVSERSGSGVKCGEGRG